MKKRHLVPLVAVVAGALAAPAAVAASPASPASAAVKATGNSSAALGNRSLAAVLTSDGNQFDRNWYDYDIVTEAVLAVIAAKPDSPVGLLTQGKVPLTAFIPNDRAFQVLATDLTGKWYAARSRSSTPSPALSASTRIEQVLLYHVIPGATITAKDALNATASARHRPARHRHRQGHLHMVQARRAQGQRPQRHQPLHQPEALDINKGNKQIAHGIFFVLRPADL